MLSLFAAIPAQAQTTVSFSAQNFVLEGDGVEVTVRISATLSNNVDIPLTVTPGSAETGDYFQFSSFIRIPAGSQQTTFGLLVILQDDDKDDETFTIALGTLPSGLTAGSPSSVTVTIRDDDRPAFVSLSLPRSGDSHFVREGESITVTVTLSEALPNSVEIPITLTPSTAPEIAAEPEDYGTPTSITINAGETTGTGTIVTNHDPDTDRELLYVGFGILPSPIRPPQDPYGLPLTIIDDDRSTRTTTDSSPPPPGPTGGGPPSPAAPSAPTPDSPRCGEDREDLESFYEATGGENWHEKENWNSDKHLGEWYGVETDDGNVVSLLLPDNNLSGDMPTRELLCLEDKELVELALWGNELSGDVPEELVLAVERAVLRDIEETLNINPEWFKDYRDPYDFKAWHTGVMTDDGRVTELDFTGEKATGEIPESVFELSELEIIRTGCGVILEAPAPERVRVEMPDPEDCETELSGDGGCALGSGDSSVFGLFLVTLLVFAVLGRTRARG